MKNFLINFYNQTGAGPKNISLNFIEEALLDKKNKFYIIIPDIEEYHLLKSTNSVTFLKQVHYLSIFKKIIFRLKLDFILIPKYVLKYNIISMLSFGNYLISPIKIYKIVLLHHPYLVDNDLLNKLPVYSKLLEKLKRIIFYFTIKNSNLIIVQSSYIETAYNKVWSNNNTKTIYNPISRNFKNDMDITFLNNLIKNRVDKIRKYNLIKILYVSRYYPHKNHMFIIDLARLIKEENLSFQIYITLNYNIDGSKKILDIIRNEELNIVNIGELPQIHLEKHYKECDVFLFPSKSETFGNPLIEAMCYGLPIVVPTFPYAKAVVSEAGLYYDNLDSCIDKLKILYKDEKIYTNQSILSINKFKSYPTVEEWYTQYINILEKQYVDEN